MEEYGRKRDECITQLFQVTERSYGFTDQEVRASLTRRPIEVDAAIMISFFIIYVGVGKAVAFRIWRMRDYGSFHTKLITVYAALLLGFAFVLVGGLWYDLIESIRIGNGHVSYRGERAPWDYHHVAEYVAGVVTFCVTVVVQRRTAAAEVLHRPVSDSNLEAGRWLS